MRGNITLTPSVLSILMSAFLRTNNASVILLALIAATLRALVGLWKPELTWLGTVVIGLTTTVFLVPALHHWCWEQTLLNTRRKQLCHGLAMAISGLFFLEYVVYS